MKGSVTAPVKFQEYSEQWFKDCAELNLKASTLQNYRWLSKRAYKALGFMRMDRITPRHIQRFIREMTEGELMGLEFRDFDFEYNTITVKRTSNTNPELGIYTDTVKSKNSNRALKLPQDVINLVRRYQAEQEKFKAKIGSKWTETGRLFVKMERGDFGTPMHPNAPGLYFERFCQRTGMRYVSNHSWRHLYASSLIENGVDIKTVQHCMGHSSSRITLDLYCHVFQAYQAKSMAVISGLWTVNGERLGNITKQKRFDVVFETTMDRQWTRAVFWGKLKVSEPACRASSDGVMFL